LKDGNNEILKDGNNEILKDGNNEILKDGNNEIWKYLKRFALLYQLSFIIFHLSFVI